MGFQFKFCLGKLEDLSTWHGFPNPLWSLWQSGCAKVHLDRSEEVLAQQTAAHEEAEAAVGHCDHVGCQKVKTHDLCCQKVLFDLFGINMIDPVGSFQLATMFVRHVMLGFYLLSNNNHWNGVSWTQSSDTSSLYFHHFFVVEWVHQVRSPPIRHVARPNWAKHVL